MKHLINNYNENHNYNINLEDTMNTFTKEDSIELVKS